MFKKWKQENFHKPLNNFDKGSRPFSDIGFRIK